MFNGPSFARFRGHEPTPAASVPFEIAARNCDACGLLTTLLAPIALMEAPSAGDIPPFVCIDYRACVARFTARETL
jgi:hypothetical protein